jgi:predicted dehydrogenase
MQPLRCAVLGWGAVSRHMLAALDRTTWAEVVAVVDVREDALAEASDRYQGVVTGTDLAVALGDDVDAVLVNTPSHLHFDQVAAVLDAGKHALVAKPITNDFEHAARLVDQASKAGVTLSVGQQMRYMRHYQAVGRVVAAGDVGTVEAVTLLNAKPRPNVGNLAGMQQPALFEMACHHFDSLAAVLGDPRPVSIAADGFTPSWSSYDGPSMVNALIRFEGGLHALYQGGFASQGPSYELRLEGTAGALRCRGVHMSVDEMTTELARPAQAFAPYDVNRGLDPVDPWAVHLEHWRDYVRGGTEPPFSGRRNLAVMALLSAGIESVQSGGAPVDVCDNPRFAAAFGHAVGEHPHVDAVGASL